jgi:hypothetical protein
MSGEEEVQPGDGATTEGKPWQERHTVGGNTARVGRSASDTLGFMVSLGPNS